MQTERIQFSVERMKDAIRYETRDGCEVSQVTFFDGAKKTNYKVAGIVDGRIQAFETSGLISNGNKCPADLFIITEKQIKYPCLCWVSDMDKNPNREICQAVALMCSCNQESGGDRAHWNYSTPLTDDELAEFGLARAGNEK